MLILAVTSSSFLVWQFTKAGPAPGRSATITPGTGSPCDVRVYIDSGQYGAANCRTGDNYGFNTVPDFGATINSLAIPNCPANGCRIYVEPGTYQQTTVINTLVTGDDLGGGSRDAVIIQAPSPAGSVGKDWIVNKDQVTGDKGIILHDFTWQGGTPTISGASYVNYDNFNHFQGAYQSHFYNLRLINSGVRFDFFSGATATQKETTAGLNYDNNLDNVIADSGIGSNAFFSCNDCHVIQSDFLNWGDDAFLVAGWGRGVIFDSDSFDGTNNPHPTVGGSTGQIYALNDGSVVANTNNTAIDITISNSHFANSNLPTTRQDAGISVSQGATVRISNTVVEREPGVNGGLTCCGGGIVVNGVASLINVVSRYNKGTGVTVTPIASGTVEGVTIVSCTFYDNGQAGTAGALAGISLRTSASTLSQVVLISSNRFFDDQGSPTQTVGIDNPVSPTTPSALLQARDNDFTAQPTSKVNINNGANWNIFKDNIGYNAIGKITNFVATAGTTTFNPWGASATVVASTTYTVRGTDIFNFTSTAGTGVVLSIKDSAGNCIVCGAASINGVSIPVTSTIAFGAFSVAPTVKVYFN